MYKLFSLSDSHLHCFPYVAFSGCAATGRICSSGWQQGQTNHAIKMRSFQPYQPAGSTHPEATPLLDPVQGKGQQTQLGAAAERNHCCLALAHGCNCCAQRDNLLPSPLPYSWQYALAAASGFPTPWWTRPALQASRELTQLLKKVKTIAERTE